MIDTRYLLLGDDFLRIAIIDDLRADREQLTKDISHWAQSQYIPLVPPPALFESGETFLGQFFAGQYDVIFLDIYMKGMNGMDTARRIREIDKTCCLIFTTTTTDFAVDSYEVDSSWYLVKPYSYEALNKALIRCNTSLLEQNQSLSVTGKNGQENLYLHQIAWTEFVNRRVCVHFKDGGETLILMRQGEFRSLLLSYPYFCDCMKGILVNFEAVEKLLDNCFWLPSGVKVPISRLKYKEVREHFLDYSYMKTREE